MSEHDDFKAWLKTWALPGNTSREDAMYAAWQARADRTAPVEPVAWVTQCRNSGLIEQCEPDEKASNPDWTDAFPVYTAPDVLQAEVERLREDNEVLTMNDIAAHNRIEFLYSELTDTKAENDRLREEVERLREERDSYQRVGIKALEERDSLKADADRYRWFKENCCQGENLVIAQSDGFSLSSWSGDDPDRHIDAAIDAARTAKPEVGHE